MNILLIYPSGLDKYGKPLKYKKAINPPLTLAILAGLTPEKHSVHIIEDMAEDIDYSNTYDLVGISAMTMQSPRAYQIAERFRKLGVKVIIGGIHATLLPQEVKNHADSVAIGEVENIWETILDDCERNKLKDYYKDKTYPDLKKPVIPKWDNFNMELYFKPPGFKYPTMPIFTSRGCPFDCNFCCINKLYGRKARIKPIQNVLDEIDTLNAEIYFFVDDNFASDLNYCKELFKELQKREIKWFSEITTIALKKPEFIELAVKAGCLHMFIGIESIDNNILANINKSFNKFEEYEEIFNRVAKAGILAYPSIIFGFDGDTRETLSKTVELLQKWKIYSATLALLTPCPGTKLFEEMERDKRIIDYNWSLYDGSNIVFKPKNFTVDELFDIYWKSFRKLFSMKNILKRSIDSYRFSGYSHMRLISAFSTQFNFRKKILKKECPYLGGIGRINEEV